MSAFRFHPENDKLRADDVDLKRVAKEVSNLVDLAKSAPGDYRRWPDDPDKWLNIAAKLLGAADLHEAQALAKRDRSYRARLSPAQREEQDKRDQRRAWLHEPLFSSVEEAYLDTLFSADFCKQFPARWRELAVDALRPESRFGMLSPAAGRVDLVVGTGRVEVIKATLAYAGQQGVLIDLNEHGALAKLVAWSSEDHGMASTTVGFLGLSQAIAKHGPMNLLAHLAQFAKANRRSLNIVEVADDADLAHFMQPPLDAPHFDEVLVHYLDKLFDELQWSKHVKVQTVATTI
ncbi:hypothetical protein [Achromobacter kerstersii]